MESNPWKIKSEKNIYDNPWINLTEYQVVNPNGGDGIYGKVHFKNTAIGIMVLDDQLNTYLVGQFRFPLNAYSWEIPEGGCPLGTDPLLSGKRELLEETGLLAAQWDYLFAMHLSNSVSDEKAIVYLARTLTQSVAEPEDTEKLTIKKVPFFEAVKMVENGEISDSMSVAAIFKIQVLLAQGKLL